MVLNQTQKAAAKKLSRQKKFASIATAKAATDSRPEPSSAADEQLITPPTQQRILDVFGRSFSSARSSLLDTTAAQRSSTSALGYAALLVGLKDHLRDIITRPPGPDNDDTLRVVSIGGGPAEVGGLAGFLLHHHSNGDDKDEARQLSASVTLLDSEPWGPIVSQLHADLTNPPPLSKYASAAARAVNAPLVDPSLLPAPSVQDAHVLSLTRDELRTRLGLAVASSHPRPLLVTFFFTLHDFYTSGGIGNTTSLLLDLSAVLPLGSLLLVVESPGSHCETTTAGKESRRVPMHWLLEHTLLQTAASRTADDSTGECRWEKVASDESACFRVHRSLRYSVEMKDMRYQMHLYRARLQDAVSIGVE